LIKSIENNEIYVKSDAILKVTEQFGFFWYMFSTVNLALPLFVRNCIYDMVAKNRYNILGKRDQCRCADGDYSDRFM
jgi:predicted DCC family thiol-disulfide oxidoreductase YuxK